MRRIFAVALVIPAALLAGCTHNHPANRTNAEQRSTNTHRDWYQKNQPVPQFDWSQYRQTVLDVEQAQVHGVATTTFFFNLGTPRPIKVCPSIGFPVPTTAQLTNPDQVVSAPNSGSATIGQAEPNGVYPGGSSGTYVVCVAPSGVKYVSYWEGDVQTEGGPAHWDDKAGRIVLDGKPTVVSGSR